MTPTDRKRLNTLVAKYMATDDELVVDWVGLIAAVEGFIEDMLREQAVQNLADRGFTIMGVSSKKHTL